LLLGAAVHRTPADVRDGGAAEGESALPDAGAKARIRPGAGAAPPRPAVSLHRAPPGTVPRAAGTAGMAGGGAAQRAALGPPAGVPGAVGPGSPLLDVRVRPAHSPGAAAGSGGRTE